MNKTQGGSTLHKSATSVRAKAVRGSAVLAASLSVAGLVAGGVPPAGADPRSASALVGVGSDTTQDVMNALSGFNNGINYTPVQSSVASGQKQLTSWDATPVGGCITPKAPGATFDRPNGSTNGRRALSRAIDGGLWGASGPCGTSGKVVSGLVDFARSSAGPSGTGTDLTYIPFGRDAMSFAYSANGVAPVTTLSSAQLNTLYTVGPQTISGVEIVPCLPQTGSGTYQFWLTAVGATANQAGAATAACGQVQENDANGLKAKGDTFPGKQVVIGFSAANFISQSNGVAPSQLTNAPDVDLGSIDSLGKPYTGTGSSLSPAAGFYASTKYGRDVYNVVPTAKLGGFPTVNADFKSMFVGTSSAICSSAAQTTVNAFGFLSLGSACGSTTLTGPKV